MTALARSSTTAREVVEAAGTQLPNLHTRRACVALRRQSPVATLAGQEEEAA